MLTFILSFKLYANDTLVFRISNPWRPEKTIDGRYIRKVIATADSGLLAFDYNGNKLIAKGYFSDTNFIINLYGHYFYNVEKGFPQEIKWYDSVGNLNMHAELTESGDTIWRQTFKDEVMVGSKVFNEYENERTIFFSMQKPAVFPGGYTGWKKFIASNLKYPKEARKQKIQGSVTFEFTVLKDGKITNPKIIESMNALLDQEAMRLILASPHWLPAEENGVKIDFVQKQSIVFKL